MARLSVLGIFGVIIFCAITLSEGGRCLKCGGGPKVNLGHITKYCKKNSGSLIDLNIVIDLLGKAGSSSSGTISGSTISDILSSATGSGSSSSLVSANIILNLLNGIIGSPTGGSILDLKVVLNLLGALIAKIDVSVGGSSGGSGNALINLSVLLQLLKGYDGNLNINLDLLISLLGGATANSDDGLISIKVLTNILTQVIGGSGGVKISALIKLILQILGGGSGGAPGTCTCSCTVLGNLLKHGKACHGLLGGVLCLVDGLLGGVLGLVGGLLG